ncbi:MAG: BON domain-containing protein [Vicinamibacteria bacterium]
MLRAFVRAIVALVVVFAVIAAVILYRSGKLPYQKVIEDAAVVGSAKAAYALHRQLAERVIRVKADAGRVVLTGVVATRAEKNEAEDIARSLEGVTAVENFLEVEPQLEHLTGDAARSLGETLDDVALLARVRAALSLDREVRRLELEVTVRRGSVALRGRVPSEELKNRALQKVGTVDGVENIEDGMEVAE